MTTTGPQSAPDFTWTEFYEEMAEKLSDYDHQHGRRQLVEKILSVIRESSVSFRTLDKFSDGRGGYEERPLEDICPFTIFASLNILETDEDEQKRLASSYKDLFGIDADVPDDFDGVPQYPQINVWWFRFAFERDPDGIKKLWRVFRLALDVTDGYGEEYSDEFRSAFNEAADVKRVGHRLPSGLYWIRPRNFLPLDSNSREYLRKKLGMRIVESRSATANEYLSIRDQILDGIESRRTPFSSFQDLSYRAWAFAKGQPEPPTAFQPGISSRKSSILDGAVDHRPFDPSLSGSGDPVEGVPTGAAGSHEVGSRTPPRDREAEKIAHDLLLRESNGLDVVRYGHMTSALKDRGDGSLPGADFAVTDPKSGKTIKFVEVKSSQGRFPRSIHLTAWELVRAKRCASEGIPYEVWIIVFASDNTHRRYIWRFDETVSGLKIEKLDGVDVGVNEADLDSSS
ncbi:MAG: hypothetical protein F4X20_08925 [Dehalococcoidia bacterium]|nr:hypothetical protein [Dehalococcoidia bacterium]